MKAAQFKKPNDLEVVERPLRALSGDEVLVQIAACGVCGTDVHIFAGEAHARPPVILGHEFAGTVIEAGNQVRDLRAGDHVAVDPNIVCGGCYYCRRGQVNFCENLRALGVDIDGGFAEFTIAPAKQCYKLPEDFPLELGAFAEPISCCIHGIERAQIQLEDAVIIIGAGNIGLLMVQLARAAGAGPLIVLDPVEKKREIALKVGANLVLDPFSPRLREEIHDTIGDGADVVIECVGKPPAVELAVSLARGGGRVLLFGMCDSKDTVTLRPQEIFYKELTMVGSVLNPFTFPKAVNLLAAGKVSVEPFAIQRFHLDDIIGAFEEKRRGEMVKSLVVP
jgi:L-iditol 2-dehydrogenase